MRAGPHHIPARTIDGPDACAIWSAGQEPRIDTTTSAAASRSQTARLVLYLGQMFLLQQMLPNAACPFFAIWLTLQALGSVAGIRVTWTATRGANTALLFLLLMRMYDGLKDAATDLALGRGETYSRVLRWKSAALLPTVFSSASVIVLIIVGMEVGRGMALPVLIAAAGAACGLEVHPFPVASVTPPRRPEAAGDALRRGGQCRIGSRRAHQQARAVVTACCGATRVSDDRPARTTAT